MTAVHLVQACVQPGHCKEKKSLPLHPCFSQVADAAAVDSVLIFVENQLLHLGMDFQGIPIVLWQYVKSATLHHPQSVKQYLLTTLAMLAGPQLQAKHSIQAK